MCIRDRRLNSSAGVKRLCLAALSHMLQHTSVDASHERIRGVYPHLPQFRSITEVSASWGSGSELLPPVMDLEHIDTEPASKLDRLRSPTTSVSSYDASSSSSSDEKGPADMQDVDQAEKDEMFLASITWAAPPRGLLHWTRPSLLRTPLCSSRTLAAHSTEVGIGILSATTAMANGRSQCPACLSKLDNQQARAVVNHLLS